LTRNAFGKALVSLALVAGCGVRAQWAWRTITSTRIVSDLCPGGGRIWGATEGGLIAFDPRTSEFETWRNTEGLPSNGVTALAAEGSGALWIGFSNGLMQRRDIASGAGEVFEDYRGHSISRLRVSGDSLFVGLDIGVSLYRISRREVRETYRKLGTGADAELPVVDLLVSDRRIWAVTDAGLSCALLDGRNLLDPENWTTFAAGAEFPLDRPTCLVRWKGRIVAGGYGGVAAAAGTGWESITLGFPHSLVTRLEAAGDSLFAASENGVYLLTDGSAWMPAGLTESCRCLAQDAGTLYAGTEDGLREWKSGAGWTSHVQDCPKSSRFTDLAVDLEGVLWGCSSAAYGMGLSRFDGTHWINYLASANPLMGTNNVGCVAVDRLNRKWFGTAGNGLLLFQGDTCEAAFNVANGYLSTSAASDPNYPLVTDVAVDTAGALWALNFTPQSYQPLVAVPAAAANPDSGWTYYGPSDGPGDLAVRVIAVDALNRKWIGTDRAGVYVVDDAGTWWDSSDDPGVEQLTEADGLADNSIKALAVDNDGTVWIGTTDGLYAYSFGALTQINAYYTGVINALMVDGVNNVWVGTDLGFGYFSTATYSVTHFTVDNSPLVDNQVISLAYDPETGRVYAGTNKGLSCIETPFSRTVPQLERLSVSPNPFLPAVQASVVIDGLSQGVAVSIFTSSGIRGRLYPAGNPYGRRLFWNGENDRGEPVASGIYVIVARSEDGRRAYGKVAVVR
jgi:ligand-binding sensor domain-containing protein